MSRYIDADALLMELDMTEDLSAYDAIVFEEMVKEQPTAITHCTRCQEWHPREATDYGFCIRWGQYTKGSDYCSYGK